jgi:hypothetical protein
MTTTRYRYQTHISNLVFDMYELDSVYLQIQNSCYFKLPACAGDMPPRASVDLGCLVRFFSHDNTIYYHISNNDRKPIMKRIHNILAKRGLNPCLLHPSNQCPCESPDWITIK